MSSKLVVVNGRILISDKIYMAPNGKMISAPTCWAARVSFDREEIKTLYPMLRIHASGARSSKEMEMTPFG